MDISQALSSHSRNSSVSTYSPKHKFRNNLQETYCLDLAQLAFQAEMKFTHDENQSYFIKSAHNDIKLSKFNNTYQIEEVLGIIGKMKE